MNELERQTVDFANLSNFVALKGGAQREQMISGDMADIFSIIYLAHAVNGIKNLSELMTKYLITIERLMEEKFQSKFNNVIENMPYIKPLLWFSKILSQETIKDKIIVNESINTAKVFNMLTKDIDVKHTPLKDLIDLDFVEHNDYINLTSKIIQVGEYCNDSLEKIK